MNIPDGGGESMSQQWLIVSGPDGYSTKIVEGWNQMERAVIEAIFGSEEPDQVHAEEAADHLDFLRDDSNWARDWGENHRTKIDFEDGYVEVLLLAPAQGESRG